jgi:predicted alpha-1,2-mannosidase
MLNYTKYILFTCLLSSTNLCAQSPDKIWDKLGYVRPSIGTGAHGHVFMGVNVPFGAVQIGPVNISQGWDWCSGYHYSDSVIIGFSHTHLSGTGIGDLGDILFMPATGPVKVKKGTVKDLSSGYASLYRHYKEEASLGIYSVQLERYNIWARFTASKRVAFHDYSFDGSSKGHIVIDLEEGIGDRSTETFIRQVNDTTIEGYRYSRGWARDQRIYFTAVFSLPIERFEVYEDSVLQTGNSLKGVRSKGVAHFNLGQRETVQAKVGISPVSTANALANIRHEVPHWDFSLVVREVQNDWQKELKKIEIRSKDVKLLKTFYTALYHTMIAPSIFNDHNGDYRGTDKQVYEKANFTNLTTFSLWDTYRAAHPLYTILQPDRVNDMVNSMLAIYQQQGKLPVWHLVGNETNTMPGNSAIPVIADAYNKGFRGFDTTLAWEAIKTTATRDERGLKWLKQYGYIPADSMVESVAMGLEYAIDDGGAALMAKKMGKQEDYNFFKQRSKNYRHYFDPQTGFMRGRVSESERRTPFSPFAARHMKDDFAEGNAWQYTWLVPHDVEGLIKLLGGEKAFVSKLDSLFIVKGDMGQEASADITGLIGQYAHGNEPSHHIAYLYAFAGEPWKTAPKVRYILENLYSDGIDGLCGNEDVGQMSAWYVLSALGFYPVHPSNGLYVFGSPIIDEARIDVGAGKTFQVQVRNNSKKNIYIQKITLNGNPYTKSYLLHEDIMKGGKLLITMGAAPSKTWGVDPADRPYSER